MPNGTEFSYLIFTEQRNFTTAERRKGNGKTATEWWKPRGINSGYDGSPGDNRWEWLQRVSDAGYPGLLVVQPTLTKHRKTTAGISHIFPVVSWLTRLCLLSVMFFVLAHTMSAIIVHNLCWSSETAVL